jgi:hypothetical protein
MEVWERTVRAPSPTFKGLLDLRTGPKAMPLAPFPTPREALPPAVVQLPVGGVTHWRFTHRLIHPKPPAEQLRFTAAGFDLPLRDGSYSARDHLTARVLRTYLAMWALADEYTRRSGGRNVHGLFYWQRGHVILRLFECKPRMMLNQGRNPGRVSERAQDRDMAALDEDFAFLQASVLIAGNSDVQVEQGEPLVHRYGMTRAASGEILTSAESDLCAHARIAWAERDFFQVPLAVLRAHAVDVAHVPALLGITHELRRRYGTWSKPGHMTLSAGELLGAAGVDVKADRRKWGRAASAERLALLKRALAGGEVGQLVWSESDVDEATKVTLEPSAVLASAYTTLDRAIERARRGAATIGGSRPATYGRPPGRPSTSLPRATPRQALGLTRHLVSDAPPVSAGVEAGRLLEVLGSPDPTPPRQSATPRPAPLLTPSEPRADTSLEVRPPDPEILAELERAASSNAQLRETLARYRK